MDSSDFIFRAFQGAEKGHYFVAVTMTLEDLMYEAEVSSFEKKLVRTN